MNNNQITKILSIIFTVTLYQASPPTKLATDELVSLAVLGPKTGNTNNNLDQPHAS